VKLEKPDREKIRQLIVDGKSNQEIVAEFQSKYPTIAVIVKNIRYQRKDWDKSQTPEPGQ
jgi:cytochrome c-type biogenesis protein CcmH/NrfF